MNLRQFIQAAESRQWVTHIDHAMPPDEKLAREIHRAGDGLLYVRSRWNGYRVIAGVCTLRRNFALAFDTPEAALLSRLTAALGAPAQPPLVEHPPCQDVVETDVNLEELPILTHTALDGGAYVTAGIAVTRDAELGRNWAFHRLMRLDRRRCAIRLVEGRGTHQAWLRAAGDLPVAICIGAPLAAQLAGALSPPAGVDELEVAHALAPTPLARCVGLDLEMPAESEIVLEGRITHEMVDEGPFIDLTGAFDLVRRQPVVEIDRITHRRDPIYQALLPGGPEHKLLMGMPREPTIFQAVSQVCDCRDVVITPGGASWLHAVVQIHKRAARDGRRAIRAAFLGHTSLKHVVVVDDDINIHDPAEVEWAIATRFQANRDLIILRQQPSSSLDPSALHIPGEKTRTAKMGLDATIPWEGAGPRPGKSFGRANYFAEGGA